MVATWSTWLINYITKDISTVTKGIIIHGCNAQGVMGSGVAKALRNKYPAIFNNYKAMCGVQGYNIDVMGQVSYYNPTPRLLICNAITQEFYGKDGGRYASVDAIDRAIQEVIIWTSELYILDVCYTTVRDDSQYLDIFMPKIGCGLGGLSWDDEVLPVVQRIDNNTSLKNMHYKIAFNICDI